jgi:hypothetical protein
MAEAKSKSKTAVDCTLCDKPITTGKPVMIDDDPYHSDCAKAMEQSAGAAEDTEEEEDAEEEEVEEDGEDESDEAEEDEEEDEEPVTTKVTAKAPAKSAKRVVAAAVEDDEDEDDEDDEDDEEEEEVVVTRPVAKKAVAKAPAKAARRVVEEDDEDEDDEEEEEEVVVRKPVAKAATKPVAKAAAPKRAAADYDEEDEPEERPTKAKTATKTAKPKAPAVDTSGWGNPATAGSKRYFVYQALHEVSKSQLDQADGPGKPENVIARAKRLQRDWARETKVSLGEKEKNFTSMNVGWIYNHADELNLVMRTNPESGTFRIWKAKAANGDA